MNKVAAWAAMSGVMLAMGCTMPPPPEVPLRPGPDAATLARIKTDAYQAGFVAGRRLQARRDAAALAAAKMAAPADVPAAAPACPPAAATPAPAATPEPAPVPGATAAPVYTPGGPAVPLSPAQ